MPVKNQHGQRSGDRIPEITSEEEEIVFPKKWKDLSTEEQRQWIETYYMPKTKIPEPILRRNDKIESGTFTLKSGSKLKLDAKPVILSKRNPNLVREFGAWVGNWLVTVFHDKSFPHIKYFGIANPTRSKWIAQQLSSEICREFYSILLKIRWKYGFFKGKRRRKPRKTSISTLSLKNNNRAGEEP